MAILVPAPTANVSSICGAVNASLKNSLVLAGVAYTGCHASPYEVSLSSELVAASDLPTLITLVNKIATNYGGVFVSTLPGYWPGHISDAVAHLAVDATNDLSAAVKATDLATAETLTGLLRTQMQAHFAQAGCHINNDAQTISITAIDGLATCITVANSIRTCYLAHIINAPGASASAPYGLRVTVG